jgi:GNAT superfamily N-acetyltransferase
MSAVTVRAAALEELHVAGELRREMAREEGVAWDRESPGWHERFAAYFRAKQERGDSQVFFAVSGDRVVGMAAFSLMDEYRVAALGQRRGWVNSVFVVPEYRRRGIALALMNAGLDWLRERDCVKVRLRTSDDGQALYERLGFVRGREMERSL